jgi:hypothetical protein
MIHFFREVYQWAIPRLRFLASCLAVGFILAVAFHTSSKTLITASVPAVADLKWDETDRTGLKAKGIINAPNARSLPMKSVRHLSAVAAFSLFFQPGFAQKLVDPNTVAPEFRAAAEKRRAEQINLNECVKKANDAKVPKRDRAGFISGCAESNNQTPTGEAVK